MTALTSLDIGENQLLTLTLPEGLGSMKTMRISGNTNMASLSLPRGMTNLTGIFLRYNQLTNLSLPSDLNSLATMDVLGNQLLNLELPSGLTHLSELFLGSNLLTQLTLPADMTQLTWLILNLNPLAMLVLPEPLAATNLVGTVAELRAQGVSVYVYPLTVQLTQLRQPIGAFQFAITGPPGVYSISASVDLIHWSELQTLTNALGAIVFTDGDAHLLPAKFYRARPVPIPANMVYVQPNTFLMGSATNEVGRSIDEGPQTLVTLSRGFWVSKFLVTQREYLDVMGSNPSGFAGDLSRPVESVTWFDATNYCGRLTQRELTAGRIVSGSSYRLPTEAEWECAARAGTSTRYYYGDDPGAASLANYAWFGANGGPATHDVGLKLPNGWGLYDMEGNVWEWCQNWYAPYPGGTQSDPLGPSATASGLKVIRGGAWESFDSDCRSARRMTEAASPFISDFIIGFRVVLATEP
jgi:formylglycine-generating enzyme required for sulfatase activity